MVFTIYLFILNLPEGYIRHFCIFYFTSLIQHLKNETQFFYFKFTSIHYSVKTKTVLRRNFSCLRLKKFNSLTFNKNNRNITKKICFFLNTILKQQQQTGNEIKCY